MGKKFNLLIIGIIIFLSLLIISFYVLEYLNNQEYEKCIDEASQLLRNAEINFEEAKQDQSGLAYLGFMWINRYQECMMMNNTNIDICNQITSGTKDQFINHHLEQYEPYSEAFDYTRKGTTKLRECEDYRENYYLILSLLVLLLTLIGIINGIKR